MLARSTYFPNKRSLRDFDAIIRGQRIRFFGNCRIEIEIPEGPQDDRAARRINELLHPLTCHDWLWKINPRDGSRLAEDDFLLALGSRHGATQVAGEDAKCAQCGEALDGAAAHSTCCAPAESTRGHYMVVSGLAKENPRKHLEQRAPAGGGNKPKKAGGKTLQTRG